MVRGQDTAKDRIAAIIGISSRLKEFRHPIAFSPVQSDPMK
jgi:hypothetical protein